MQLLFHPGQPKQEGSPPGANQEAKSKQEEGRESARPSRPAVSQNTRLRSAAAVSSAKNLLQASLSLFSAAHPVLISVSAFFSLSFHPSEL